MFFSAPTPPGRHRKPSTFRVRRSVAVAGALSLAVGTGVSGSVAGASPLLPAIPKLPVSLIDPLAPAHPAPQPAPAAVELPAPPAPPQILAIAEFKPVENLRDQVLKAIAAADERRAADEAARAPRVAKPAEGILTSPFGPRWGTFHAGIDIANSLGTPILSAEDGTVIDAGPASGYGQWVRVRHDDGTITVYGHMETINVSVGQHVTAGQQIAGMGSRGFSTGVHLHFEVHPGGGGAVDPIPWLAQRGISV